MPIAYVILTDTGKSSNTNIGNTLMAIKDYVDSKVSPYKKLRGGVVALEEDLVRYCEDSYQHEWQGKDRRNSRSWIY